jgi:hypothetical protein
MTAARMVFGVALLLAQLAPALAQDGCDKFAWPLTRERALLAASDKPSVKAGDTLATLPKTAIALQLTPGPEATFVMQPERKSRVEPWFGGMIKFPALEKAGIYQITLSDEAWLDVVQDGRYARSVGSTGRGDCPGLRKSVRLELSATPFVLQFSGVAADKMAVTIGPRD